MKDYSEKFKTLSVINCYKLYHLMVRRNLSFSLYSLPVNDNDERSVGVDGNYFFMNVISAYTANECKLKISFDFLGMICGEFIFD
jgi:hypothetical protein